MSGNVDSQSIACVFDENPQEISTVFRFFSMVKPLPTFQRIYTLEKSCDSLEKSGDSGFLNRRQRSSACIRIIILVQSGTIWMHLDASGKSLRNVDSGTATVNMF